MRDLIRLLIFRNDDDDDDDDDDVLYIHTYPQKPKSHFTSKVSFFPTASIKFPFRNEPNRVRSDQIKMTYICLDLAPDHRY